MKWASHVVSNPDETKVRNVAFRVLQGAEAKEKDRENERSYADDAGKAAQASTQHPKPIVFPWERADWIALVREKLCSSWGIAVLRTSYDLAAWLTFRIRLSALVASELARIAPPAITNNFNIHFIEDEDNLAEARQAK